MKSSVGTSEDRAKEDKTGKQENLKQRNRVINDHKKNNGGRRGKGRERRKRCNEQGRKNAIKVSFRMQTREKAWINTLVTRKGGGKKEREEGQAAARLQHHLLRPSNTGLD